MDDWNTEVQPIDIEDMDFVPFEELFAHFLPDLPTDDDTDGNDGETENEE